MENSKMANTDHQGKKKIWEMIKDIKIALMVTTDSDGNLRSRPMAVHQTDYDGFLWFFTNGKSSKIAEIKHNPDILLAYSDPDDQNYVSVTGEAEIVHDRALIKEMWSEMLRVWFPKGSDDPDISLIKVEMQSAEYWDVPSSAMIMAYGYVKSVITGEAPNPGENKKVSF
jgi:general stress protein 26